MLLSVWVIEVPIDNTLSLIRAGGGSTGAGSLGGGDVDRKVTGWRALERRD